MPRYRRYPITWISPDGFPEVNIGTTADGYVVLLGLNKVGLPFPLAHAAVLHVLRAREIAFDKDLKDLDSAQRWALEQIKLDRKEARGGRPR